MQENSQVQTTPPLPGPTLVDQVNKALQTIGTNFAGDSDPAALAWPYAVWADTANSLIKRRDAANNAWVIEGTLLRASLPQYPADDIPATDRGPIYVIGVGPMEWDGAAYQPMIRGIPGATFAEINALASDEGPIICIDQGGAVYVWGGSGYVPLLASELRAGAVRFATTAETQALTDDTTALTPKKLGDVLMTRVSTATDLDSYTAQGAYLTPASGVAGLPTGWAQGRHLLLVDTVSTGAYRSQRIISMATGRMAVRTWSGSAWGDWVDFTPLGVGQTWQDVTAQRAVNTTYTNTTGRTIEVFISSQDNVALGVLTVNGVGLGGTRSLSGSNMSAAIPPGAQYSYDRAFAIWAELR